MVNRIINVFGARVGIGYDIGCSFKNTVKNSSLSLSAHENNIRFVVPSFHGYAHNRRCQLYHHPLYVTGFGLEDIETCERLFSSFNGLAPVTRYASSFHRHQAIDIYAEQWDTDKYQELCKYYYLYTSVSSQLLTDYLPTATFLLNNYIQVQEILQELPCAISALQSGKTAEHTDYHRHIECERAYLSARKDEPAEDVIACEYIVLLQKYKAVQ